MLTLRNASRWEPITEDVWIPLQFHWSVAAPPARAGGKPFPRRPPLGVWGRGGGATAVGQLSLRAGSLTVSATARLRGMLRVSRIPAERRRPRLSFSVSVARDAHSDSLFSEREWARPDLPSGAGDCFTLRQLSWFRLCSAATERL